MHHSVTMTCNKACFRENQKYLIPSAHLTFVSIKSESNIKIATKHRHICHVSLSSRWKFHNFNRFSVEVFPDIFVKRITSSDHYKSFQTFNYKGRFCSPKRGGGSFPYQMLQIFVQIEAIFEKIPKCVPKICSN